MLNRRILLVGGTAAILGGCTMGDLGPLAITDPNGVLVPETDEPFPVAAVDMKTIPAQFHRRVVSDPTGEEPGTIVVDPSQRYLYLVEPGGRATRYGIGVGRQGFSWNGEAIIRNKRKWPSWHPPKEMQARDERARQYADGMPGGPDNPLGARALYLFQGGRDTLYRIHGTNEPKSIGRAVSSGCIRMLNADVIDLYERVPAGTRVVVVPAMNPMARVGNLIPDSAKQFPGRLGRMVNGWRG